MNFSFVLGSRIDRLVRYAKPESLEEALALLSAGSWKILAGGTDFYPAQGSRPIRDDVLDINGLGELRGTAETETHLIIGARTTWTDIVRAKLPPAFDALRQAAREVGSVQIQNTGTIAGNLCNASPAADGVPALLVLDAEVELRSAAHMRRLPLQDFILGNRKTARQAGELVTTVLVPKSSTAGHSSFHKLGARRYLVISIAMAAVRLAFGGSGTITAAAVAVGACSAVAQRLTELERALIGLPADDFDRVVDLAHFDALTPIDDVRGSAEYRRAAAREIVVRALRAAAGRRHREAPPSVLPDISPAGGEIGSFTETARPASPVTSETISDRPISPLEGEMSGRTEGGEQAHPSISDEAVA